MASTKIKLLYDGVQISQGEDAATPGKYMIDAEGDLLSLEYTDNADGQADDLRIELRDTEGLWRNEWLPEKGSKLRATIFPAFSDGQLDCGDMWIDEVECKGNPSISIVRAVSVPIGEEIRGTKKTRAWESVTFEQMVEKIAREAGIDVFYKGEAVEIERVDQHAESDLSLIHRLGADFGYSVKVSNGKLIVYDQEILEDAEPITVIDVKAGDGMVEDWGIVSKTRDVYRAARVMYRNPIRKLVSEALKQHKEREIKPPEFKAPKKRGKHRRLTAAQKKAKEQARWDRAQKTFERKNDQYLDSLMRQAREEERRDEKPVEVDDWEFLFTPFGGSVIGPVLEVERRVKDEAEAKRVAERMLRNANRDEVTLNLRMAGDVSMRAGMNVEIVGVGKLSGKYHIDSARHSVLGGYTTNVGGHRVLAYR